MPSFLVAAAVARLMYTNPVYDRDLPDPGIVRDAGAFWMTHTTGGPNVGCPLYRSTDAINWTFRTHLLNASNKPAWATDSFWAPEILPIARRRYLLTFTAWSQAYNRLCIGIASATNIEGPYTFRATPLVVDSVSVLDSDLFLDAEGSLILYWKRDGNGGGINGDIRAQRLDASGTAFLPGSSPAVVLTGNENATAPEAAWEKGLVEAPWMQRRDGLYYLFYSGAFIDTSYALGVARSTSPYGPFVRAAGNPILKSNSVWGGPGHGAFFRDDAGVDFHYYHARRQSNPNAGRVQMLDRLLWSGGWPSFGNGGTPSSTAQPGPTILADDEATRPGPPPRSDAGSVIPRR